MTDFFKKLNDNDFFSDKLTHIYFNGDVEKSTVDILFDEVIKANKKINIFGKTIKPKPILIHINSNGGSVYEGMRFLSIFKISEVPIATIIDNYSFSAATFLSVHSPYRIMTKNSFCLLHYYSVKTFNKFKRGELISNIKEYETYFNNIIDIYLKKTKINKEELYDLLQHDLLLDYKYCLDKGIVDRIIDYENPKINTKKNIYEIIKDVNTINIYLYPCSNYNDNFDKKIRDYNEQSKIRLIYPNNDKCYTEKSTIFEKKDVNSKKDMDSYDIFHSLNLINRVKAINGTKIAIINVPISIDNILPLLYTNKIYIYNHSFIICNLLYFNNPMSNILMVDTLKNYKTIFNKIKTILKQKTKMSIKDISNIDKKYIIINPKEAIKLGLCHEIIYS
jgi:ATP-dependent protease ClpP protease subunit